jgi:peptidoglycan hydrolase CwlO-like protein
LALFIFKICYFLAKHSGRIDKNASEIDGLHQTTNKQGKRIEDAHGLITGLNGNIGTINGRINEQGEIIGQHTIGLNNNKEEFDRVHSQLNSHHGRLENAESENNQRIQEIEGVGAKLDEKVGQIHTKIDGTNGEVAANKSAIGEHKG